MKNNLILTMKAEKELSAIGGEQTLVKQPTNHPLITHLSPTFGSHLDAIRKYAAMVILMLFIGVGQMRAVKKYSKQETNNTNIQVIMEEYQKLAELMSNINEKMHTKSVEQAELLAALK